LAAALPAAALYAGVLYTRSKELLSQPWRQRLVALMRVHALTLFLGGIVAHVVIGLVWVSQIH